MTVTNSNVIMLVKWPLAHVKLGEAHLGVKRLPANLRAKPGEACCELGLVRAFGHTSFSLN
jgi:hypothetical protein